MRQIVKTVVAVSGLMGFAAGAQAMPVGPVSGATPAPTFVAEGCGPGFHRGREGRCLPNEVIAPRRECPRGTHLGPEGRECRPNL